MSQVRIETVRKLNLQPGDILHIQVGGEVDVNGSVQDWIPTADDIAAVTAAWHTVLPEGTPCVVSHAWIDPTIVSVNVTHWPPRFRQP